MDNREIRHERRKKFFIQAAMEILKTGDESLINAKEIASRAGYSASSLYDYFENLDELLTKSVDEYMEEIKEIMIEEIDKKKLITDKIKVSYMVCTKYFLDNPLLFKTVFMSGISKAGFPSDPVLMPKFHKMEIERRKALKDLETLFYLKKGSASIIEQILTPNMFGMLYMFFFGIYRYSKEKFLQIMEMNIDSVLKPFKEIETGKSNGIN